MVSTLTLIFIVINLICGIAIPVGLILFFRNKYKVSAKGFLIGALTMLIFALILERLVHVVVLNSSIGVTIRENMWLYALYGGLMAGLFEETGRLLSMRFLMKKEHGDWHNALMYGAGHGGFEVFMILFVAMLNNIIYSVMINTGNIDVLMSPLDETNKAVLQNAVDELISTPSWMFLMGLLERVGAISAQLAFSVIVWLAVKNAKCMWKYYILAVFMHFFLDASTAVLSKSGCPIIVLELIILILAAVSVCIAKCLKAKDE